MTDSHPPTPTTVSVVLGGGGARGLAHIGVIHWLVDNGYRIESIAGSSMGALIGGIYAAGRLDVYEKWVLALERMQVLRLLDPAFGREGLFKGERVIGVLRELVGDRAIESLPIAFTAVATDLDTGQEVWLREGKLFDAIRASIATPLVFTPFPHGGRLLLDGALVNPLPIAPTLDDDTALTIAVDLSGPSAVRKPPPPPPPRVPAVAADASDNGSGNGNSYRQRIRGFVENLLQTATPGVAPRGMIDIAFVSMQAMQDTISRLKLAEYSPDVVVEVPRSACGFFEFWRAEELIALGRERAAHAFAQRASAASGAAPGAGKAEPPADP